MMGVCRFSTMRVVIAVGFVLTCFASLNAQEQTGTIVFYREPRFATGDFKPTIFCDGAELARIENGTSFQITAPTGLHRCTVESLQRPVIEVNVLAGRAAYVHIEIQPGFTKHAVLANTTESEYSKQKGRLRPLQEWSRDNLRVGQPPEGRDSGESSAFSAKQPVGKPKDTHSGKFGDLAVSVSKIVITPARNLPDRDELAAFVGVANTGKGVVCATLAATLNTTFALQYPGFTGGPPVSYNSAGFPPAPRMNEMLPGESAEGSYVFEIKHGVAPLELVIRLTSRRYNTSAGSIRCASNNSLRDIFVPNEIRLDVHDFPLTELQPSPR